MAWFCLFWHVTPSEYRELSVAEHRAMCEVQRRATKKRK